MKRLKLIIRFLEKHNSEAVQQMLDGLYSDWSVTTSPVVKVDQHVRGQLFEISDFIAELDTYVRHGNTSELGFYVLTKFFFDVSSFEEREQLVNVFIADWKRNSPTKNKSEVIRKLRELLYILRELNSS